MSDATHRLVVAFVLGVILGMAAGDIVGQIQVERRAVALGHADWITDQAGGRSLRWRCADGMRTAR